MASPFTAPVAHAAHAGVVGRTPAPGSSRKTVKQVKVSFAEKIVTGKISVSRGGKAVAASSAGPSSSKKSLVARFSRKLASGSYKVAYTYLADDGDRVSGSWSFKVR
jgi:copper resistance protein C